MAKKNRNNRKPLLEGPRKNEEIEGYYNVRVIYTDEDGKTENIICPLKNALKMAYDLGLDLIEISPNADPPVVKIGDYSKYMYDLKKKEKLKKQNKTELKEMPLSVSISKHDMETKAKKVREFIEKGDKVKVTLTMRKRELLRREENKRSLLDFILMLEDISVPESMPKDEGNKCVVILKKK